MYQYYDRCEEYFEEVDTKFIEMEQKEIVTKVWKEIK